MLWHSTWSVKLAFKPPIVLLFFSYNLLYPHWISFHSSKMPTFFFLQLFELVLSLAPALQVMTSFPSFWSQIWCYSSARFSFTMLFSVAPVVHTHQSHCHLILCISFMILSLSKISLLMCLLVYCQIILLDH